MKSEAKAKATGATTKRRGSRQHRARPTPKWLKEQEQMDDIARRRCLLVLRVLSGQVPVTDAIEEVGMSRATYYKLEERALRGMLAALSPMGAGDGGEDTALQQARARAVELENKMKTMEKEQRRVERLAMLTKKLLKPGPLTMPGRGRPAGAVATSNSIATGPNSSNSLATTKVTTGETARPNSTPKPGGVAGR